MRSFFEKLNALIERYMWTVAPLGIVIGVGLGDRIKAFQSWGVYIFAFMTFTGSISMKVSDFARVMKHPRNVGLFLFNNHVLIPFAGVMLGKLLCVSNPSAVEGLALVLGGPVAVVSFMWTSVYKGDSPLSLTLIMLDTLLTPILLPLTMRLAFGASIEMNTASLMASLCWMVVLPVILAVGLNELTRGKASRKSSVYLKPLGKLALFLALVANTSKVSSNVLSLGADDLVLILLCLFITVMGFFLSFFCTKAFKLDRSTSIALTFAGSLRNTSAALVVAVTFFSAEAGMPIIMIILFQQLSGSVFARILFEKHKVNVACAVMVKDSKVYAAQRADSKLWEFPGGKLEKGESAFQAIVREMGEEFDARVTPIRTLDVIEHDYPKFHISLSCILCTLDSDLVLKEHLDGRWVTEAELEDLDWAQADRKALEDVRKALLVE
ncbi:MAG: NUDIX domain-containing protein [Sphaerochaetaceae bacterium]